MAFYEIYCGFKTADRILQEVIAPLADQWMQAGITSKWFFIRYGDPQFHLRVRFLLSNVEDYETIQQQLYGSLQQLMHDQLISKVQADTYDRETDRYGINTMELSERVFYIDSWSVVNLLQATTEVDREERRWLWAMRVVDNWLSDLGFADRQKLEFVQQQRDLYAKEFHADTGFNMQLDKKYRQYRPAMEVFMKNESFPGDVYGEIKALCHSRRVALQPVIQEILAIRDQGAFAVPLEAFIASHIHMMVNRVIMANARLHELIVYDFLVRHYQSLIARRPKQDISVTGT